ncbi:transcriptional regulator, BadM/Rrf2 family [Rhodopirellula maiorica SM1]|uniref:Transcriptional regulator, BadM/Rrf2 family n=1 Tax=Rhodopirellula maiorica SM1 TaxID=1265738 RepID=M5RWZ9_9BACT|nr:Rrf2 family transcriptional regulator [Rhodopirellula maiorica]EMI19932.1 transcriptional regulator, BadM/Rrf2 family [Rhodopirellula maiorica SM1]
MYGKATETAIAALSRLAEVYDGGQTRLSATEIAENRGLQRPFLGKILSTLAQAGLIEGMRGPGGGFTFAVHPREVKLYDVYCLFERDEQSNHCPFGGGICGVGEKCPLHDRLADVRKATDAVLHNTTFDAFRKAYRKDKGNSSWRLHRSS